MQAAEQEEERLSGEQLRADTLALRGDRTELLDLDVQTGAEAVVLQMELLRQMGYRNAEGSTGTHEERNPLVHNS